MIRVSTRVALPRKKKEVRKTKRSYKLGVTKLGKMQRPWGKCNESAIWYSTHDVHPYATGTCLEYNLLQLEFCGVSRGSPACSLYLATGTSHFCCPLDTRDTANNDDHSTASARQHISRSLFPQDRKRKNKRSESF